MAQATAIKKAKHLAYVALNWLTLNFCPAGQTAKLATVLNFISEVIRKIYG